jgi:hypothetical protein
MSSWTRRTALAGASILAVTVTGYAAQLAWAAPAATQIVTVRPDIHAWTGVSTMIRCGLEAVRSLNDGSVLAVHQEAYSSVSLSRPSR